MKKIVSFILVFLVMFSSVSMGISDIQVNAATTLLWPVPGHTATSRGWLPGEGHYALDISDSSISGADVVAAIGGKVVAKYTCSKKYSNIYAHLNNCCDGFGNGIIVYGDDGRWYQYAHMQAGSIPGNVYNGGFVTTGTVLGKVGSTGAATGPHLHFEINTQGMFKGHVNPQNEKYVHNIDELLNPYIDVNVNVDGAYKGVLDGVATFDVYINGEIVSDDVTDYFVRHPKGTTYDIKDLKITGCYVNVGSDSFSGTIDGNTDCRFVFETAHVYDFGTVTTEPTCIQDGIITYRCVDCGTEKTENGSASGHEYVCSVVNATCTENAKGIYRCAKCSDTYETDLGDRVVWSDWSIEKPEGDGIVIQEGVQYRYSDRETMFSNESQLEGWELTGSTWNDGESKSVSFVSSWPEGFDKNNSLYSQYNNTAPVSTETETQKIVIDNTSVAGCIYWHWCSSYYNGSYPINRFINDVYTTWDAGISRPYDVFHAFFSTEYRDIDMNAGAVSYENASVCNQVYWWQHALNVMKTDYTEYTLVNEFVRNTPWSEWSTEEVLSSDTRTVETRTVYRYSSENVFATGHIWDDGTKVADGTVVFLCMQCGETSKAQSDVQEPTTEPEEIPTEPEEDETAANTDVSDTTAPDKNKQEENESDTAVPEDSVPDTILPDKDEILIVMKGDVNSDNRITAADARTALRISAFLVEPDAKQSLAADINIDGKITASDARKILRVSASIDSFDKK